MEFLLPQMERRTARAAFSKCLIQIRDSATSAIACVASTQRSYFSLNQFNYDTHGIIPLQKYACNTYTSDYVSDSVTANSLRPDANSFHLEFFSLNTYYQSMVNTVPQRLRKRD